MLITSENFMFDTKAFIDENPYHLQQTNLQWCQQPAMYFSDRSFLKILPFSTVYGRFKGTWGGSSTPPQPK